MDAAYWDRLAAKYDQRVLNAWDADRRGVLKRTVREHADASQHAVDFGCGTGNGLRLLSESFKTVRGYDYSKANLRLAANRHAGASNVSTRYRDLSKRRAVSTTADFAVCVNVLIGPDMDLSRSILRTIVRSIRGNGRLLLVVPSYESALHVDRRLLDWNLTEGVEPEIAEKESLVAQKGYDEDNGIVPLDGVRTKHYRKGELAGLLKSEGLSPVRARKVSYAWKTEFENPPPWLGPPYPWDWMVLAEKHSGQR